MNIIFILDVKLIKVNNKYYTTGAVNEEYINKHKFNKNDNITLICREVDISNNTKLDLASGDNIKFYTLKKYSEFFKRKKEIDKLIKNSDFCFIKLPTFLGILSYKSVLKNKIKYIVEVVGCAWSSLWFFGTLKAKILAPIVFFINRICIKKAKNVLYVSNEFLQKRYPNKFNNIGCSDVNINNINNNVLKHRIKKIENQNINEIIKIGIIGSLDVKYKGHKTAFKAISLLINLGYNVELHCLGSGKKENWEKILKKLNIKNNIIFDGVLPAGDKVFEWMDHLDIYWIPSLTEGLPRALVEAMSRGLPVIGTNVGGIPELISPECLIKKNNYVELAYKTKIILDNKIIQKKFAEENFNSSLNYEKNKLEKKRKDFYFECLK